MKQDVERTVAFALVVLAHVLLFWAWRFVATPAPRDRSPGAAENVAVLRLIAATPAPTATLGAGAGNATPLPAATPAARATRPSLSKSRASASVAPQTITGPAEPEPAASSPAAQPRTLELSVPRTTAAPAQQTIKEQMLNDPRVNTPRANVESRIAALNGPDRWQGQPMDDTRTRWRRNGHCIEVHVARNAQLDPYNQSFSPTPKAVKPDC